MKSRTLGKTGRFLPIFGLGGDGSLLGIPGKEDEAQEVIALAYELGVRYFDTAHSYGKNQESEKSLGQVLPPVRRDVYINTKTTDRTYDGASRELEQSLKHLKTDYVDCLQIHGVDTMEDVELALAKDGVLRLLRVAKADGRIRYAGFTGHNPWALREVAMRQPFDTVLCCLNPGDKHHLSVIDTALGQFRLDELGIVAMKVYGGGAVKAFNLPLETVMHYALSLPGVALAVVGCANVKQLRENVSYAESFKQLSTKEMRAAEKACEKTWKQVSTFKEGV